MEVLNLLIIQFRMSKYGKRRLYSCKSCGKNHRQYVDYIESDGDQRCVTCKNNDNVGKTFGSVTIVKYESRGKASCLCECGKMFTPHSISLVLNGGITSCGCGANKTKLIQERYKHTRDDGDHIGKSIAYSTRVSDAKRRGYSWEITKAQWLDMAKRPCNYCGMKNSNRVKGRKRHDGVITEDFLYNGVDRFDNTKGYTIGNSVPCCKYCNMMKRDMTIDEFINHIKRISNYLNIK